MRLRTILYLSAAALASASAAFSAWGVRKLHTLSTAPIPPLAPQPARLGKQLVALVINPIKPGAAQTIWQVRHECAEFGWSEPLILETTPSKTGEAQAITALEAGADVVLVGGGDGTVRAVAGALMNKPAALGIVPLGTGNLFARHVGIPINNIPRAVNIALHGAQRLVDMGISRIQLLGHITHKECFLVMGGIGLDAKVIANTNELLKEKVGWLAYSEAGLRLLPGKRQRMQISLDNQPAEQRSVRSILFANLGTLPGGLDFTQGARIDDGLLDVVVMSPRSLIGWAWIFLKTLFRHKGDIPAVHFYQAKTVSVWVGEPTETEMDGDLTGKAVQIDVNINPHSLLLRVPVI